MLSYEQALAIMAANIKPLPPGDVRPGNALGWVSAENLCCDSAVPPFDNSAMDGFALRSTDTTSATTAVPVRLRVTGMVLAGNAGDTAAAAGLGA